MSQADFADPLTLHPAATAGPTNFIFSTKISQDLFLLSGKDFVHTLTVLRGRMLMMVPLAPPVGWQLFVNCWMNRHDILAYLMSGDERRWGPLFPEFCCSLPPSGSTCQFRFDSPTSCSAERRGGLTPLHVQPINTSAPPPSTLTDVPSLRPSASFFFLSASDCRFSFECVFLVTHTSEVLVWVCRLYVHSRGRPPCDGPTLRRWTGPLAPSLKRRSHGRLHDGLGCYGVCEVCTRQLCLLATSNGLLTPRCTVRWITSLSWCVQLLFWPRGAPYSAQEEARLSDRLRPELTAPSSLLFSLTSRPALPPIAIFISPRLVILPAAVPLRRSPLAHVSMNDSPLCLSLRVLLSQPEREDASWLFNQKPQTTKNTP